MSARDELLKPSLADDGGDFRQIHSLSTLFVCAFFGGPFACIAMSAWNSVLLRRKRDAVPCAIAVVISVVYYAMLFGPGILGVRIGDGDRSLNQFLLRVGGLVLFGAFWWLHRSHYRALAISSAPAPGGIGPGLACIAIGVAAQVAFVRWFGS